MSLLPSQQEVPALVVEMAFGADLDDPGSWVWTDLSDRLLSQQVGIRRGGSDWGSQAEPTTTSFVLSNLDGALTPDNPASEHWPNVVRTTPVRLSLDVGGIASSLSLPGSVGSYAQTPDDPSLHITGDLSVRFDGRAVDWGRFQILAGRADAPDNQSWYATSGFENKLFLNWTPDGTEANRLFASSTETVTPASYRLAWRIDLDVDNGGSHSVTFYSAPTLAGPWTQFGDPVQGVDAQTGITHTGTTSVFAGTAALEVGSVFSGTSPFAGEVNGFELYDGLTRVAAPDFTTLDRDTTSFVDDEGLTWSIEGEALILATNVRFVGQVDSIAPTWPYGDLSGPDPETHPGEAQVTVTASGALRRLSQGAKPLNSPVFRAATSPANSAGLVAYWPCEDGTDATQAASPLPGVAPLIPAGDYRFATDDSFPGSKPLLQFTGGQSGRWAAQPPPRTDDNWMVTAFLHNPTPIASPAETLLLRIVTTGTIRFWRLSINDTTIFLRGYDVDATQVFEDGFGVLDTDFEPNQTAIQVVQEGADIRYTVTTLSLGGFVNGWDDVRTNATVGRVLDVSATYAPAPPDGITVGHVAVTSDIDTDWLGWQDGANNGYIGETAGRRAIRLCEEEDIPLVVIGDPDATEQLGPQRAKTLLELLREAADADMGILADDRNRLGLIFRTRRSLYNQPVALPLDAAFGGVGDITRPFEPVLDDQGYRNDVTVTRSGGSSARKVSDPPPKPGELYDESVEVNVANDWQLPAQAGWRHRLGSWPGMRHPAIASELTVAPHRIAAWLAAELGDRVEVTNLPPQHPADAVSSLIQGYTETISTSRWTAALNCSPAGPWDVGTIDDTVTRADTAGSEMAAAVDEADTDWSVATTEWPPWRSTAAGAVLPFDVEVNREDVTVTDIDDIAVTFGSVGVADHDDNASVTPGLPGTLAAGNLMVMLAAIRSLGVGTVNTPAGWTRWPIFGPTENVALFAKVAGAGEGTPTVTFAGGSAGDTTSAQIACFAGTFHDVANLPVTWGRVGSLSAQDIAYPATRVPYDGSLILYVGWKADDWTSVASPGTEIAEPDTTTGNDQGIVWAYTIQTTSTDIAAGSFVVTGGAANVTIGGVIAVHGDVQTFTVTRPGVGARPHATGEPLALAAPMIAAM